MTISPEVGGVSSRWGCLKGVPVRCGAGGVDRADNEDVAPPLIPTSLLVSGTDTTTGPSVRRPSVVRASSLRRPCGAADGCVSP
jgi:hypothetical protein